MLVFGCFHLFLGLLNVCELMVRKLSLTKCLHINFVSASHGASSEHDAGIRCFLQKQSPTNKQPVSWMKKHNLWPDGVTIDEILMQYRARISRQTGIALVSLEQKSNKKKMLVAVAHVALQGGDGDAVRCQTHKRHA